jgi:hypothetical protein
MEATTMLVWVLLTTGRIYGGAPHVSYSPPLVTQEACEQLKAIVVAKHRAATAVLPSTQHECIQLPMAVPDSNARGRPLPKK